MGCGVGGGGPGGGGGRGRGRGGGGGGGVGGGGGGGGGGGAVSPCSGDSGAEPPENFLDIGLFRSQENAFPSCKSVMIGYG